MGLVNIFSNNLIVIITFNYCLVLHCMAVQGSMNSACLMVGCPIFFFFFAVDAILNDAEHSCICFFLYKCSYLPGIDTQMPNCWYVRHINYSLILEADQTLSLGRCWGSLKLLTQPPLPCLVPGSSEGEILDA